jgi:glycosyltransferase involved in cell wall biosynthesis
LASPGNEHIVILVENLSVPFDRRVWQEARSLRGAGYRVSVICPRGEARDQTAYEMRDGVEIYRYSLTSARGGPRGYVREYWTALAETRRLLRSLVGREGVDVVHACNPPDVLLLAALSARRRGAAFIFDHHDLTPELYQSRFGAGRGAGYWMTRAAERTAFQLADVVIATNESYRNVAIGRGGVPPENVFVVRSAPDTSWFRRVPGDSSLRRGKRHLLAYVGVMGPQDGVDHALRALESLARSRDDWHAVMVGSGDVAVAMRQFSAELGLSDRVDFLGRVSNERLLEVLSTADVALSPDPLNPLNDVSTMNKIVEYMALGVPIVSYDLREARVSAGDAAVYATANDPESFAAELSALLDAPNRRTEMSQVGRRRLAELSWAHSERALLGAYDRALRVRSARQGVRAGGAAEAVLDRDLHESTPFEAKGGV